MRDVGYGKWDEGCGVWDMEYGMWDEGCGVWGEELLPTAQLLLQLFLFNHLWSGRGGVKVGGPPAAVGGTWGKGQEQSVPKGSGGCTQGWGDGPRSLLP